MKILRFLLAVAMIAAVSGVAKADDFQMVVVDPNPNPNDVTLIGNDTFPVTLSACDGTQLPSNISGTYHSCFTGMNLTGGPLTSLLVLVPVFDVGGVQDIPGCASIAEDLFPNPATCGVTGDGKHFFVDFTGGDIPTATGLNGDCNNDNDGGASLDGDDVACNIDSIFTIAVQIPGVDGPTIDQDFAGTMAYANVTPEPSSFWLLSTGFLMGGVFLVDRRRRAVCAVPRR